jgi:uridine kinase
MNVPRNLIKKILDARKDTPLLVGIDGRGGSGKSTLADTLQKKLKGSVMIRLDDINYPISDRDRERIKKGILWPLRSNKPAKYQLFDYKNKKLGDWRTVNPEIIIIIEGVTTLHTDIRSYFDFTIWVECPSEIGFQRGVARELKLTGRDATGNWLKFMPLEEKYIAEQRPQDHAGYIINTTE